MMHILTVTPFGVIPLPIEITKLGDESMIRLEQSLVDSYTWIATNIEKRKESGENISEQQGMEEIVTTLQDATRAFINKLKHKDTPLLLVPTK